MLIVAVKNSREVKQVIQNVTGILTGRFGRSVLPTAFHYHQPATGVDTVSTGFRSLDKALGIGGLPCGHITELMGPTSVTSSGALVLAAGMAAKIQRKQQIVTIIDLTQCFDSWQAERCGLIAPQLLLTQPKTILDALTSMEKVSPQEGLMLVVLGSVTELLDQVEQDLLKNLLNRLHSIARRSASAVLFITAPVEDNPFSALNYPIGFPLAQVADIRLWIQAESWTHRDGVDTAYKASLTVVKNRLAVAGTGADLKINFGR